MAYGQHHGVAQNQIGGHLFSSEIEIAVFEAQLLANLNLFIAEGKGRRFGLGEDLHLLHDHFDLARRQIGIDRIFCAGRNRAFN